MNSSCHNNTDTMSDDIGLQAVARILGCIISAVVTLIGTVGNILSIIVLRVSMHHSKKCPLFMILIALAITDSIMLSANFFTNILTQIYQFFHWDLLFPVFLKNGYILKYVGTITLSAQMMSTYLTILVSYERYLAVCYPLKMAKGTSHSKVLLYIFLIIVMSLVYNVPKFFELQTEVILLTQDNYCFPGIAVAKSTVDNLNCLLPEDVNHINATINLDSNQEICELYRIKTHTNPDYKNSDILWKAYGSWCYLVFYFLVPVISITYMNSRLVNAIRKNKKSWLSVSRTQKREVQLTFVPLIIVAMFYVLCVPATAINFSAAYLPKSDVESDLFSIMVIVCNFLIIVNGATNFIVYSLLGERFRRTFRRLFCPCFGVQSAPSVGFYGTTTRMDRSNRSNFSSTCRSQNSRKNASASLAVDEGELMPLDHKNSGNHIPLTDTTRTLQGE